MTIGKIIGVIVLFWIAGIAWGKFGMQTEWFEAIKISTFVIVGFVLFALGMVWILS